MDYTVGGDGVQTAGERREHRHEKTREGRRHGVDDRRDRNDIGTLMGVGRYDVCKVCVCLLEERIEALQKVIAEENRNDFLHIRHRLIWQPDEHDRYNNSRNTCYRKPGTEFSGFEAGAVDYVRASDSDSEADDSRCDRHILQVHRLDAYRVSDKEARCRKRDERAEEHDELNAHSSDAVGNYLFVGDIFAQGGCFPVQYDIVPCRADLFLEITLSHFNTPSGLRRSRENTPADSCFSPPI